MTNKYYTIPLFLTVFSIIIIGISLQLDTSPEMIVGDSMQARSFPIFLMVLNLFLDRLKNLLKTLSNLQKYNRIEFLNTISNKL